MHDGCENYYNVSYKKIASEARKTRCRENKCNTCNNCPLRKEPKVIEAVLIN